MQRSLGIFVLLTVLVLLFSSVFGTAQSSNNLTWVTISDTTIAATFTASRCMDSTGTQNINVKVFKMPTGKHDANATVTAIVNEPDGDINNITFNNQNDGNYAFTYTFDVNGTYKFQINADNNSDVNFSYELNDYIYVKDFSINISFVNNNAEYSAGDSVTLRNLVVNDDGNAFNDLNTSINVFYPDSSPLHSNEEMTGLGNGEYVFSFIAPSTTGTYSATSVFSCNAESDSNNSGRFTIPAAVIPPAVDPGGEGGGGGGGGGGSQDDELKASIKNFKLEPLEIGVPASASLSVSNEMLRTRYFLVKLQILRGDDLVFYSEESVPSVKAKQTVDVFFTEKWVPKTAGTFIVTVVLSSDDKMIKYDEEVFRHDVEGTIRYDLEAICSKPLATGGIPYELNILAYNLGDYYEDVSLSWWIEDSEGQKIGLSSTPIAVFPGETIEKPVSVFIPASAKPGTYTAKVKLTFRDVERNSVCSFTVQTSQIYYSELIDQLDHEVQDLEKLINEKVSAGFIAVDYIKDRLEKLKRTVVSIKERVANYDYIGISREISEAQAEVNDLRELTERLEKEAALDFTNVMQIFQGALIVGFLIYITHLLYTSRIGKRRKKKKVSIEQRIEKVLGLEE